MARITGSLVAVGALVFAANAQPPPDSGPYHVAEILQMMSEVLQPVVVDEASLGLDAIAEVGPGGHFFGSAHTLERYETAFYRPILSDWRNYETWLEHGAMTATQRANRIWKQLLAEFEAPPLDSAAAEGIADFVARRKREIAAS